ncbi:guanine nucleotide exchange factor [Protomyces lactucae-debilis]|uniref:Guanine nucleotide exchange factor n=1 Tax=Protomyces lactucae-debilis TaxID=2754530 RepID=A0A1Y2FV09_PROLT|nr:guanine nucleotide exchange factor [Protomyces lactucae-debilis]ORY87832.1 guanine nucleotide exchange factor [Protomyces lactucae-debilis]
MSQIDVRSLLELLESPLQGSREAALSTVTSLKELTRDANIAQPLYTPYGLSCLLRYGFPEAQEYDTTALEAQRCLANALLQSNNCVELLMKDEVGGLARMLQVALQVQATAASDFLLGRILFLLCTKSANGFVSQAGQNSIESLQKILEGLQYRHFEKYCPGDATQGAATVELLKLLYSLTVFAPDIVKHMAKLTRVVLALLDQASHEGQIDVLHHAISLLTNLEIAPEELGSCFPILPNLLLSRLEATLEELKDGQRGGRSLKADEKAAPLLSLLSKIAACGHKETRNLLRDRLLVQDAERHVPLGRGQSLASRLLHTTTTSGSLTARECISALLYELSDSDPQQFVLNVGYGYASGFLTAHGLPTPRLEQGQVNPITGQKTADEEADYASLEDMTDEEKEREAERLFVLFDRLKKTGIVDVKDPIREAVESGRFEEM